MATPTRSGIPTTHAGTNFRSRLEARWAAFFDLVGWHWTYEPFDAAGYIPDFLIHGDRPFLVEVGPCVTFADYVDKAEKPDRAAAHHQLDTLVVGVSPVIRLPSLTAYGTIAAGIIGETWTGWEPLQCRHSAAGGQFICADCTPGDSYGSEDRAIHWACAVWAPGGSNSVLNILADTGDWAHRPGPGREGHFADGDFITALWRRAGNDVQWMPQSVGDILRGMR